MATGKRIGEAKPPAQRSRKTTSPIAQATPSQNNDAEYILLLDRVKNDVTSWAQKRLWIVVIVGGIAGALGGIHIFEETLRSLVDNRVKDQIDRLQAAGDKAVDRFEVAYNKSSDELSTLKATGDSAREAVKGAQSAVLSAKDEVDKLQTKINSVENQISDAKTRVEALSQDVSNNAHDDTFEVASATNLEDAIQKLQFIYNEERLSVIEDAIRTVDEFPGDAQRIQEVIAKLVEQKKQLKTNYDAEAKHIQDNSNLKVIMYYKKGEGFSQQVLRASRQLKSLGYKVDIWVTQGGTVREARTDIEKDFQGAETGAAIESSRGGIVLASDNLRHGDEIQGALAQLSLFHELPVSAAKMAPDKIFLHRPPEEDYGAGDIILIYLLSENATVSDADR